MSNKTNPMQEAYHATLNLVDSAEAFGLEAGGGWTVTFRAVSQLLVNLQSLSDHSEAAATGPLP